MEEVDELGVGDIRGVGGDVLEEEVLVPRVRDVEREGARCVCGCKGAKVRAGVDAVPEGGAVEAGRARVDLGGDDEGGGGEWVGGIVEGGAVVGLALEIVRVEMAEPRG